MAVVMAAGRFALSLLTSSSSRPRNALQHGSEQSGLRSEMVGSQPTAVAGSFADGDQGGSLDAGRVEQFDGRADHP